MINIVRIPNALLLRIIIMYVWFVFFVSVSVALRWPTSRRSRPRWCWTTGNRNRCPRRRRRRPSGRPRSTTGGRSTLTARRNRPVVRPARLSAVAALPPRPATTNRPARRPPKRNGRCTTVTYAAKASRTSTRWTCTYARTRAKSRSCATCAVRASGKRLTLPSTSTHTPRRPNRRSRCRPSRSPSKAVEAAAAVGPRPDSPRTANDRRHFNHLHTTIDTTIYHQPPTPPLLPPPPLISISSRHRYHHRWQYPPSPPLCRVRPETRFRKSRAPDYPNVLLLILRCIPRARPEIYIITYVYIYSAHA